MMKVATVVSERIKKQIENARTIETQYQSHFQNSLGDLKFILHALNENKIKINPTKLTKKETPADPKDSNDTQLKLSQQKKAKDRVKRCTVVLEKAKHSLNNNSHKDDVIEDSSSSKRSRRAPRQTTGDQSSQESSTLRTTRLRSHMNNLEEKHSKEESPPAAKRRRTHVKKPAATNILDNETQDSKIRNKENSAIPENKRFVQKQIENFEKLKKEAESKEEDVSGRVGKHTRLKATPKAESQTTTSQKNKEESSSSSVNIQTAKTVVQKQSPEEAEIHKQKEQLKRQAREVVVNKKKENILKATSEETRKKRERNIQKVAAAREATEREKALQAAKAEKEKEEKILQIAAEKERIKAEQLKKKQQQMQQKLQEVEERRKRDEEARMAKLREQEEEHKRILAMKEREMDLQKQQKAAELRLAEAEKAKLHSQTSKLNKLAAVNNAEAKLQAMKHVPITKSKDNYGIDDAKSEDSSDEESRPKKPIPLWAQPKRRQPLLVISSLLPKDIWSLFMECNSNPDVNQIFPGVPIKKRIRTSSAVWSTPPLRLQLTPKKNNF